jgi:hypothetical protein
LDALCAFPEREVSHRRYRSATPLRTSAAGGSGPDDPRFEHYPDFSLSQRHERKGLSSPVT